MKKYTLLSSNLPSVIDWSHLSPMTRGKLLDTDSNIDPTSPKGPQKQTTEPILGTALLGKNSYNRFNGKAWLGLLPVKIYREIMPSSCPLT